MAQTYHIHELDDNTQEYLFTVRDEEGHKMPGVFVPSKNYLPLIGIILGPILIIAVLIFTLGSFDDPGRTAMLQTAAIILGGWMIAAAIRVWVMQRGRSYLGHFTYVDSARLYEAKGSTVKITSLKSLLGANATDNYNEGSYQNTVVELELANEGGYAVTVSDQDQGRRFVTFLNALAYVRSGSAGDVSGLSTWDVGQTALSLADADPLPNLERKPRIARELGDIPKPQRANKAPHGLIALGVILLLTLITFLIMQGINAPLRDDAIFEMINNAQMQDKRPPLWRAYLVDKRNTRHVDRVKTELAKFYALPLKFIKEKATDQDLGGGFYKIVDHIKSAPQPVVSMRITEKLPDNRKPNPDEQKQMKAREAALEKRLADTLTLIVSDGIPDPQNQNKPREDMLALVQLQDETPAMIDITYTLIAEQPQPPTWRIDWTVQLRTTPDAKAVRKNWTSEKTFREEPLPAVVNGASEVLLKMAGGDQTAGQGGPVGLPGGPLAGTVWNGNETLGGFGNLSFEFGGGDQVTMVDARGRTPGNYNVNGNQVSLRFFDGNVLYNGNINGAQMQGTATNGKDNWNWTVNR